MRTVHPSLQHISAWISSVGAGIALGDLDGDGLANDACLVDPRTDDVLVTPVPGTGPRFAPFALDPRPLDFDETMAPMGCLFGDLNEDGGMDVLVYYWGRTPVAFVRGQDGFDAVDVAPGGARWFTNAATRADIDGDGHVDLIFGNYFRDGARILDAYDDERQEMQLSMSRATNAGRNRILLWAGDGATVRFEEATNALVDDIAAGWALAVGAADLDGDLLPEIYFAHDFGPDRLLHNRSVPGRVDLAPVVGEKTLFSPNSKVLGRDSFKGMGVDFAELNGDGMLDFFVSNIAEEYALEESHFAFLSVGPPERFRQGIAPYADRSEPLGISRTGWSWDARFGDFDNDGVLELVQATGFVKGIVDRWPELHETAMGNDDLLKDPRIWHRFQPGDDLSGHLHNPFFVRSDDGRFVDMAPRLGLDQLQVSRGIATADVDGDGDLDFVVANQWEPSYLYRNDASGGGAFLGLRLMLPVSGGGTRPAIGARAEVEFADGRRSSAQVDGGNGHSGARSPELHFGLGAWSEGAFVSVRIAYRDLSGDVQEEKHNLAPGWHTIVLGEES